MGPFNVPTGRNDTLWINRQSHDVSRKPRGTIQLGAPSVAPIDGPLAPSGCPSRRGFSFSSSQLVKISAHCDQIWKGDSGIDLKISQREMPDDQPKPLNRSRRWFIAFLALSFSLGWKPRRQYNVVPQYHQTRRGIGLIGSSMGGNAGTKAKTTFRNHYCSGLRRPKSSRIRFRRNQPQPGSYRPRLRKP